MTIGRIEIALSKILKVFRIKGIRFTPDLSVSDNTDMASIRFFFKKGFCIGLSTVKIGSNRLKQCHIDGI